MSDQTTTTTTFPTNVRVRIAFEADYTLTGLEDPEAEIAKDIADDGLRYVIADYCGNVSDPTIEILKEGS